jgi:ElaB/YqjD/DUF883 family membrane-anchored ribosome-binding protein
MQTPNSDNAASPFGKKVADTLDEKKDAAGDKIAGAARTATDAIDTTADYVRERDVKGMLADVRKVVRNNPGPALVTAAALGFLIARILSRK